jgi:hypothetical protein
MEAYKKVKEYLCDNVGNMVMPGTPRFDARAKRWHVSVLCKSDKGIFVVGEILLDKDLQFLYMPTKEMMLKVLKKKGERVPFLVYATRNEIKDKDLRPVLI